MVWDPIAKRDPVTFELDCSRDENGVAHASATFRPWGGAERIAYEDAATVDLLATDSAGDETLRLGTMRVVAAALTIDSVEGFPAEVEIDVAELREIKDPSVPGGRRVEQETVRRRVPFDPKRRACLLALDGDVLDELTRRAREVQPLPGIDDLGGHDDADEEDEQSATVGGDDDPFVTPSTPEADPAATAAPTTPASPAASSAPRARGRTAKTSTARPRA